MLELKDQPAGSGNGQAALDPGSTGLDDEARRSLLGEPPGLAPVESRIPFAAPARGLSGAPHGRRLVAPAEREALWKRWLFLAAAIALAWMHFYFTASYWAPAHWGNNQNGYLVGARNLATTMRTTGFEPSSPFEFVGWMWVMADGNSTAPGGGLHYPKYPIGVSLVDAVVFRIGLSMHGEATAIEWVYRVSPIAMALALLGTFFLTRELASSFAGLLAMILMGTLPLVLILSNNPNSHALSLCFICWGMYAMVRWWETLSLWRGLLAGLLLGYAVTIRYTEGLLLLPMMLAGLLAVAYRPRALVSAWRVGVWVLFPVAAVVVNDSLGRTVFPWQAWLTSHLGESLAWWHRAILVALPILITLPWTALHTALRRDAILGGEWLRMLACALIVLAAATVRLPHLEESTPPSLHLLRLIGIVLFFAVHAGLMHIIRWRELRTWVPSATLAVGWLIPVIFLLAFNKLTVGSLTGYDTTNESSGFTWQHFTAKWQETLNQLYNQGLYFILPLGLMGMLIALQWSWRAAMLLLLWFIPGTLLYMAYYYGRGMPLIGYLRFFTSMLPAAVIAAVWLIHRASTSHALSPRQTAADDEPRGRWTAWWWNPRGSIVAPLAAGLFVALPATISAHSMIGPLERDGVIATNLAEVGKHAREAIPEDAVIFAHSQRVLNYLQFAGKDSWKYYGADYFSSDGFRGGFPVPRMGSDDGDQPTPIQPARRQFLTKAYAGLGTRGLIRAQNQIMIDALEEGKRVFLILERAQIGSFRRTFLPASKFETKLHHYWRDPATQTPTGRRALASLGADVPNRGTPTSWEIIEVTLKPQATTQPATQPTIEPAEDEPAGRRW